MGALETERPWATRQERDKIKRMVHLQGRGCVALFGRVIDIEKPTVVEERRAILEAVGCDRVFWSMSGPG